MEEQLWNDEEMLANDGLKNHPFYAGCQHIQDNVASEYVANVNATTKKERKKENG